MGEGRVWVFSDIVEEALRVASSAGEVVVISYATVSFSCAVVRNSGPGGPQPRLYLVPGSLTKRGCMNSYLVCDLKAGLM